MPTREELQEKGYSNTHKTYASLEIWRTETKIALIKVLGENDVIVYCESNVKE